MALESSGVISLAGVDQADLDLFIATMEELVREVPDQLSEHIPLWKWLDQGNRIEKVGTIGTYIAIPQNAGKNPTVQWIAGYDDAISTPHEVLEEARAQYGHLTGRLMTNREEMTKNSGSLRLFDLTKEKDRALQRDLRIQLYKQLLSTDEADGRKPTGLRRIVQPATTLHGLDPSKKATSWWKPTIVDKDGAGTNFALATEFRPGMRKFFRQLKINGDMSEPDLVLMGEDVWDAQQDWAEGKLQLMMSDMGKAGPVLNGDTEMTINGRTFMYVPELGAKEVEAYNSKEGFEVRAHSGTWFEMSPWDKLDGKVQTTS